MTVHPPITFATLRAGRRIAANAVATDAEYGRRDVRCCLERRRRSGGDLVTMGPSAGHLVRVESTGILDRRCCRSSSTASAPSAVTSPEPTRSGGRIDGAAILMIVPGHRRLRVAALVRVEGRDGPGWCRRGTTSSSTSTATVHVHDDAFVESVVRSLTELHEARRSTIDRRRERSSHPMGGRPTPRRTSSTGNCAPSSASRCRSSRSREAQAQPEPQRGGPPGRDRRAERIAPRRLAQAVADAMRADLLG